MDTDGPANGRQIEGLSLGECLAYTGRMVRWETDGRRYWLGGEVLEDDDVVGGYLVAIVAVGYSPVQVQWANPACLSLVVENL